MSPKKPSPKAKPTVQFNFRCTEQEITAFRAAAERSGLDVSNWLRQLARRAAGLPTVADALEE